MFHLFSFFFFFFFTFTATTEIYTLSLHDALPISYCSRSVIFFSLSSFSLVLIDPCGRGGIREQDRKSTRLNSSHQIISYAVFCLKKKNISIFVCLSMVQLMVVLISVRCSLLGHCL